MRAMCAIARLGLGAPFALLTFAANAQTSPGRPAPPSVPNPTDGGNLVDFFNKKTPYEFWLTCVILLFGLIVIGLLTFGMKGIQGRRPEDLSRSLIVVMVITSALVLITAGFSNDQIAPAFGLFGTIVGYMLGRLSSPQAAAGTDHAEHQDSGSKPAGS
ncbi:MAG: hypothetical protein V7608_5385 [Hyphomicrobiales bacterium]|jgi:hypothetical protein